MKLKISTKHLQIDKAQSRIILITAIASAITIFCLVSSKALLSQAAYQRKVLGETNKATTQLKENAKNANKLVSQYKESFIGNSPTNIIGGRNTDDGSANSQDGTNGRIILDALPTSYDFPALVTSVSSILEGAGLSSPNLGGSDQSLEIDSQPVASPQPVPININVSGNGTYTSVKKLVYDFERSIRPFDVTNLSISGGEDSMQVSLTLNTYFQPSKALTIGTKEIK